MKTAYVGKIWFSSYGQKRSLPIRFQYSLVVYLINQLTSEVYFLHVDRHEWTQQGWLNSFLKKNSLLRQKGHFNNFVRTSAHKFCIRKGPRGTWKLGQWFFQKQYHFGPMGNFGPKNGVTSFWCDFFSSLEQ